MTRTRARGQLYIWSSDASFGPMVPSFPSLQARRHRQRAHDTAAAAEAHRGRVPAARKRTTAAAPAAHSRAQDDQRYRTAHVGFKARGLGCCGQGCGRWGDGQDGGPHAALPPPALMKLPLRVYVHQRKTAIIIRTTTETYQRQPARDFRCSRTLICWYQFHIYVCMAGRLCKSLGAIVY